MPLNTEQQIAVDAMKIFLDHPTQRFFLLAGYAGTGKTYCMQYLMKQIKGRLIFTAPTNKATKVLRDTVRDEEYSPECKTIYSLLGLQLAATGEVRELITPDEPVDLKRYRAVVVDEASMINSNLWRFIVQTARDQGVKFIFMGDSAQLPPVKELISPVWGKCEASATLERVMRHDNQILKLATFLRTQVSHPTPKFLRESDNGKGEGVWDCAYQEFRDRLINAARQGRFTKANCAKAVAWRNVTVDALNKLIRAQIFDNAESSRWLPDDRVILTEPAKNLDDEVIATTDDEGIVIAVVVDQHPLYPQFKVYELTVTTDDNRPIRLYVLHEDSQQEHAAHAEELATIARANRRKWEDYWQFQQAFHKVRHAYAITAHRAQGSTYEAVFIDWKDILQNRNRSEAFRCLYVACTRAKKELYLG